MNTFDHKAIEKKWQKRWEADKLYETKDAVQGKDNEYMLVEFPYPSGNLHIGHWYAFAVPDIFVRQQRMEGKNMLFPIGFDSFGLPAENAAIKRGLDPREWTYDNIYFMTGQLKSMGNSFDWSRKVVTSDPEYYKWTQWLFLQFYEKGLAYKKQSTVPWCDSCKTVLANEQIVSGECERCGTAVVQKELDQWYFKITDYADRLLDDLDDLDWPEEIKQAQREWIGRSDGALLEFGVSGVEFGARDDETQNSVQVFTTRPDTLFGVTYMVLAPEHELVQQWKDSIENWDEVAAYIEATASKKELERKESKEKTGVELKGAKAINPANGEEVPVWIADYVLAGYGTGAVMAVPAHDERDLEFAKKYALPVRPVIAPQADAVKASGALLQTKKGTYLFQKRSADAPIAPGKLALFGGGIESGEQVLDCLTRELHEELELDVQEYNVAYLGSVVGSISPKRIAIFLVREVDVDQLVLHEGESIVELTLEEALAHASTRTTLLHALELCTQGIDAAYAESGVLVNCGTFDGDNSEEVKTKITEHVRGTMTQTYRLRDWLLSRQRYWGAPIPVVYDPEGKPHAVPDEHLPWELPNDVDFTPTGEAPLASSKELKERTEKIFGKGWTPEVDTMDTFVCSSWYFLRYLDPHNEKEFSPLEKQKMWMPVDRYSGGAEHTTMHLLYSRFFYKALFDLGLVTETEPYKKRMSRGLILGTDGAKMSKSKGNVIDPGEHVDRVGADTVKMYLAFVGPYNEVGQYPWDLGGIAGVRRFLERVWKLGERVDPTLTPALSLDGEGVDGDLTTSLLLHQTIKKVGEDIQAFKFNTAISQLMVLMNALEKETSVPASSYSTLILLLAPFAPHLTEELWEGMGNKDSVHDQPWPEYDEKVIASAEVTIAVQVNGKMRGTFTVAPDADKETLLKRAKELPRVAECMGEGEVKKEIVVPNRLVNLVVQ